MLEESRVAVKPEEEAKSKAGDCEASRVEEGLQTLHARSNEVIEELKSQYNEAIEKFSREQASQMETWMAEQKGTIVRETLSAVERILLLELDKILHSILLGGEREQINRKKNEVNALLAQLLFKLCNDGQATEMLSAIKKKLNDILLKFKESIE